MSLAPRIRYMACVAVIALTCVGTWMPAYAGAAPQNEDVVSDITQGINLLNRGQYQAALGFLGRAQKKQPQNGDLYYYMAKAYAGLGSAALESQSRELARRYNSRKLMEEEARQPKAQPLPPLVASPKVTPAQPGTSKLPPLPSRVRDKWAVVVGISKFQDPSLNLKYPAKDAMDFAAALKDKKIGNFNPEHVRTLTNELATRENIINALDDIAKNKATEEDLVVVFLSTHGSPGEIDIEKKGYFVAYDTKIDNLLSSAIKMEDFESIVGNRIRARRKIVLLDACYSGQTISGQKGMEMVGALQNKLAADLCGYGTVTITSSSSDEQSWESDNLKNGVFTYYLIEALKQNEGKPTIDQIFRVLQDKVPATVRREKQKSQNPRILPDRLDESAQIRIGVAPANQ
jgi:hypothetical protein